MNVEMIARTIQFILAPAVMVNACAVMLGGLLAHYAAINQRLRGMARERLEVLRNQPDPIAQERLSELDIQAPDLLNRHKLVRDSILAVFSAVALYVLSMLAIALAAFSAAWVATLALALFLIGTTVMLMGVMYVVLEIRNSHRAVEFEVQRVSKLTTLQPGA